MMDVSLHTVVQKGITDGLDHVAVVVGPTQTLRGKGTVTNHDNIRQMAEILVI